MHFFFVFPSKYLTFAEVLTISECCIMSSIEEKVRMLIVEKLGVEESEVKKTASFVNDLGADSLDNVELIMELEKVFDLTIPDEEAEKITTVGDAIAYIEGRAKE